jgi:GT2 family glycosyltransferase
MSRISVVIACVNGLPSIDECLTALEEARGTHDVEVLVMNCCTDGTIEHVEKKFPLVRLFHFSERLGIPELRAKGIDHATGDIVSIIEDHCNVPKIWFDEIIKAHQHGYMAVGGTVENGSVERILDWSVFLCEYSGVMPPVASGEVEGITGNNASYRKEYFIHEELKQAGVKFLSVPTIIVSHKKEFGFWYFMSQRFHYSRSFAGMRRARTSIPRRAFYVCASPLLPPLMFWRMTKHILQKKRHVKEFVLSIPFLVPFLVSYAVGEFVGYLLGPGTSLLKVE